MANIQYVANGDIINATYTGGTNQTSVELNFRANGVSLQLTPTGGNAKMQCSNDNVNWIDWPDGLVLVSTISMIQPVHFVRVVHGTCSSSSLSIWGA